MEIEVGEYIRTESGVIEKIKTFDMQTNIFKDEKGKLQKWLGETVFGDPYCEEIVKHSKNIIDLIEVGDYVNGYCVAEIEKDEVGNITDICYEEEMEMQLYSVGDIETIVTKEQMKAIEYRVKK